MKHNLVTLCALSLLTATTTPTIRSAETAIKPPGASAITFLPTPVADGTGRSARHVVSLDGTWAVAEGSLTNIPATFDREVPVPGLVDMAKPPFVEPGPTVANRTDIPQKDPRRDAFWYRRTFKVAGPIPAVATLKVGKAMFGTRVILNGMLLGDHAPCFTSGSFNAKVALRTGENELLIRVGADRDAVGRAYPDGLDFEKARYIPGIFDSVKLILSGAPHIANVQVSPDVSNHRARVRVWLSGAREGDVSLEIRETKSGTIAGRMTGRAGASSEQTVDLAAPIADGHLWSPEDPFLYELIVRTSGDECSTRFGMREFHFDPATGRAMLNGRPYFMRGSNVTLYRFFEDSERGNLPWNEQWVRLLHQRVKDMHWNCLRYCIGFPPESWYDIADETGILIDDEFPIWLGSDVPKAMQSEELTEEYAEWMRERWNHPCVVIWDACNETLSTKTGAALKQVRAMDLSNRPWDNGYSRPQEPGDMIESHPYHFFDNFRLRNLATANRIPQASDGKHAVVINEYGWHWVNRDGTPTTLTRDLYKNVLGENATPAQRFHMQATWLAADTEFWRAHRKAAAVMHFTTLGYARPDGQTSDHWTKGGVAKLQWEPEFYRYVRDAFAPVGLMVNCFNDNLMSGRRAQVSVIAINDLYDAWHGPVTLRVKCDDRVLVETKQDTRIEAIDTTNIVFDITWPNQIGPCVLEAELRGADGQSVRSVREVMLKAPRPASLVVRRPATASSVYQPAYRAENAVDGDEETYWSSAFQDDAWLAVDLSAIKKISRADILWETAYAKSFAVQVSADGNTWTDVYKTEHGKGGTSEIKFNPVEAQHVRVLCTKRGTQWGNAIRELEIFP
jgi:beta-galactosidase